MIQMKITLTPTDTCSAGIKYRITQRWIESLIGESPNNSLKESPLPKGEGQGEGKERTMTQAALFLPESN